MVFPRIFRFYFVFCVVVLSIFGFSSFGLSSACYDVVLFVVLLQCFICVGVIQTSKANLISRRYQIMVVNMLKNWSCRYSSHYFIKFVGFLLIYYAINLDIVSSFMVFSYLYLGSIDLLIYCKFESIILFFLSKKKKSAWVKWQQI